MRLPSELQDCVTQKMQPSFASMAIFTASPPTLDRSPWRLLWRPLSLIAEELLVERLSTAKRSTSTTFRPPKLNFHVPRGIALGLRTVLATPLLHGGVAIGAIQIRRREVRPFSDKQIKLLETFADQAVIAIENVRLFKKFQGMALEQQTATSEILGVIASSPTDIQPVWTLLRRMQLAYAAQTML